ncbi:hypothetical protein ACLOJK_011990 [Asimina triloba]
MRLLRFNVRMAQVVDFSNLCLLAHVPAKVKEEEDQEKENHAAVVGDESHREISIKQHEEEHHHDDYGDESRMIMTAKKRKREHVDITHADHPTRQQQQKRQPSAFDARSIVRHLPTTGGRRRQQWSLPRQQTVRLIIRISVCLEPISPLVRDAPSYRRQCRDRRHNPSVRPCQFARAEPSV